MSMGWIGINNDIFKQTTNLVEVSEINFEQFSKNNDIEELTKLYFEVETHLIRIIDFVKLNQISESQSIKLEYNFIKLTNFILEHNNQIDNEIYKNIKEIHFFYSDVQDILNVENKIVDIKNANKVLFNTLSDFHMNMKTKVINQIEKLELKNLSKSTNKEADDLFKWLVEYYRPEEESSVKFINILHYFKNIENKELYTYKLTQKKYTEIIKSEYGIKISKYDKSPNYKVNEKPILDKIERAFRNNRS